MYKYYQANLNSATNGGEGAIHYNVLEAFIALKNHPNDEEFAHKLKEVVDANNYNNTYNGFLNKKTIFKVKNNE